MNMNKHYLLALLDDSVKTVGARFPGTNRIYTYKTRLTLEVGDKAVVETPSNGLQVVDIVAIHELPELNSDSSTDYKWIVQRVDLVQYEADVKGDAERYTGIHKAQIRSHREQMKAALMAEMPYLAGAAQDKPEVPTTCDPELLTRAANEGFTARLQDARPEDNPYKEGTQLAYEWANGYRMAVKSKSR